jgi:hypothetical protein
MTQQAAAGWYPQPDGRLRYWDGTQWTEHFAPGAGQQSAQAPVAENQVTRATAPDEQSTIGAEAGAGAGADPLTTPAAPTAATAAMAQPSTIGAPPEATRPWWKMKRFIIGGAVALFMAIGLIGAMGGGGDAEAAASPTPSATLAVTPSPTPTPSAIPETFTMPDVVGQELQDAQDLLQTLGSYLMDQQDASGLDRLQINDSNWKVCSQEPAAAAEVPIETVVILASVKNDEVCPGQAAAEPAQPAETTQPAAPSMTVSQGQAVRKAESYLDFTAFSSSGLVGQLEFEGFSNADATFAVNNITVDWNEQAAKKAQSYLDLTAFSRSGLIDQLVFEGFTPAEAEYGTTAVGL